MTIPLDTVVIEKLKAAAEQIHVTVEEYARFMLGVVAESGVSISISHSAPITLMPHQFMPGPAYPPMPGMSGIESMGKVIRMAQAAQGGLTCENCTQRLTLKDVEKGSCSKCEAPIE